MSEDTQLTPTPPATTSTPPAFDRMLFEAEALRAAVQRLRDDVLRSNGRPSAEEIGTRLTVIESMVGSVAGAIAVHAGGDGLEADPGLAVVGDRTPDGMPLSTVVQPPISGGADDDEEP